MSRVIYQGDFDVRCWDIIKTKDGHFVGVFGSVYENNSETVDENTKIHCTTNPFSSITSYIYPCHIDEIVEHCGCFENQMKWWFDNNVKQPLYIKLEKEN